MKSRTLLVEDDPHIADVVEFLLQEEGHRVHRAPDGTTGWEMFCAHTPGLVILDLGLPGIPGLELFGRMRKKIPDQPVIILTARGEEEERVKGLSLGADDYMTKPFSNPELVARVRNLLRRCPPTSAVRTVGPLVVDSERYAVRAGEREIVVPTHEFRLLETLVQHPNQTFRREQLLEHMYGTHPECGDRAVDQAVKRLRQRLQSALGGCNVIRTVYGSGYRLNKPDLEEIT